MRALNEGTSPVDLIRGLEAHLAKYPNTAQRADVERSLAKAAIDSNDIPRIVKYGEPAAATSPDDFLLLDRLAYAFLILRQDRAEEMPRRPTSTRARLRIWWTRCRSPPAETPRGGKTSRSAPWATRCCIRRAPGPSRKTLRTPSAWPPARFRSIPARKRAREWAEVLIRSGQQADAMITWPRRSSFPIPSPPTSSARAIACCWASCTPSNTARRRVWAIWFWLPTTGSRLWSKPGARSCWRWTRILPWPIPWSSR